MPNDTKTTDNHDKAEAFAAARRMKALMEEVHQHGHSLLNDAKTKGAWSLDLPLVIHALLSYAPAAATGVDDGQPEPSNAASPTA